MKQHNKFLVTGIPRSGTTKFMEVLSSYDDIWVPKTREVFNVYYGRGFTEDILDDIGPMFDRKNVATRLFDYGFKKNYRYSGFKTFFHSQFDFSGLLKLNNPDIIVMKRKNVWKAIGSALRHLMSLDNTGKKFVYTPDNIFVNSLISQTLNSYWRSENFLKDYNIVAEVFFEDITTNDKDSSIDEYFQRDIDFNYGYVPVSHASDYIENIEELGDKFSRKILGHWNHYKTLPDYVLDSMLMDYK